MDSKTTLREVDHYNSEQDWTLLRNHSSLWASCLGALNRNSWEPNNRRAAIAAPHHISTRHRPESNAPKKTKRLLVLCVIAFSSSSMEKSSLIFFLLLCTAQNCIQQKPELLCHANKRCILYTKRQKPEEAATTLIMILWKILSSIVFKKLTKVKTRFSNWVTYRGAPFKIFVLSKSMCNIPFMIRSSIKEKWKRFIDF